MPEVVYNVDLLFHTGDSEQPGSMHVTVMPPKEKIVLTIVIEVDPFTPIKENIASIISGMQKDIFNRIHTDALKEADIFFNVKEHVDEFPDCEFVKLGFNGESYSYEKVDEIIS